VLLREKPGVVRAAADEPAPTSAISGPVLGWVFDRSVRGVRPILGVPGASILGQALDVGFELDQAKVSPGQDYILGVAAESREVVLVRIQPGGVAVGALPGVPPGVEQMILSPTGRAAAFRYGGVGTIHVVHGLPEAPEVKREVDLAVMGSGASAVASSDDAEVLVAAAEDGAVWVAGADGNARVVGRFGHVRALAFLPRSQDVLIADDADNAVYLLRDAASSGHLLRLAGEQDGIAGPREVVASRDGRRAVVRNGGSGELVVLDLAGGPAVKVACEVEVTGLERLEGNAVFRLTEAEGREVWLLDGDWPELRVVFAAAASERAVGGQR
jgi:hypothetical protein